MLGVLSALCGEENMAETISSHREPVLGAAVGLLRRHCGSVEPPGPPGRWSTLVMVVLGGGLRSDRQRAELASLLGESWLQSPRETANASIGALADALEVVPHGRQRAAVLKRLAEWWCGRFGEATEAVWDGSLDAWREDLRQVRGVGVELTDQLLLFVGGLLVYPLSRGSVRVACRHGWVGIEADYDEWQSFFVRTIAGTGFDLRELSAWFDRVGRDFCGPKPKCEGCPLMPLLPAGGPIEPGE